nr:MAG TPA: hypothetical protein [Caudoviricetes sp.]
MPLPITVLARPLFDRVLVTSGVYGSACVSTALSTNCCTLPPAFSPRAAMISEAGAISNFVEKLNTVNPPMPYVLRKLRLPVVTVSYDGPAILWRSCVTAFTGNSLVTSFDNHNIICKNTYLICVCVTDPVAVNRYFVVDIYRLSCVCVPRPRVGPHLWVIALMVDGNHRSTPA